MPNTTDGLPYPATTDDVDVVGDLQALANAVDATYPTAAQVAAAYRTIADSYAKAEVYTKGDVYTKGEASAALNARVEPIITGGSRLHFGTFYGTPNAGGSLAVTHGAGFSPDQVYAVVGDTDSAVQGRKGMTCNVLTDTVGGAGFSVRIYQNGDGSAVTTAVRITYICRLN